MWIKRLSVGFLKLRIRAMYLDNIHTCMSHCSRLVRGVCKFRKLAQKSLVSFLCPHSHICTIPSRAICRVKLELFLQYESSCF